MQKGKTFAVWVLLSWVSMGAYAEGVRWVLNPLSSKFTYQVNWEGIPFSTQFTSFSGELNTTGDGQPSRLVIRIRLSGLDSENDERDEGMQLPEWFWGEKYPLAVYQSDSIKHLKNGRYLSHGTLTLRGVEKSVPVEFMWQPVGEFSAASAAIMQGGVALPRLDYGIGLGEWSTDEYVGLKVLAHFNLNWKVSP